MPSAPDGEGIEHTVSRPAARPPRAAAGRSTPRKNVVATETLVRCLTPWSGEPVHTKPGHPTIPSDAPTDAYRGDDMILCEECLFDVRDAEDDELDMGSR